ncbi:MAG: ABC-F family ATP-binding cassette domain-containing protein [Opitutales bacterium]
MISLKDISLAFGSRKIFNEISISIESTDKIALVGSNGAGKTTLLKVLAGVEGADSGEILKPKYATFGYLPQEIVNTSTLPLYEEVESAFTSIVDTKQKLEEASNSLHNLDSTSQEYLDTLESIGEMEHFLEDMQADKLKAEIQKVLSGLGFENKDMQKACSEFSGGWQMRIALAKLLLLKPNLLMLDEPTNHLDISSVAWLESYLKSYKHAIILVSHDRAFVDAISTRTFALSRSKLETYEGNYSFYEKESALRREILEKAIKTQGKEIAKVEKFIERFRSKNTKAAQVQSRIKALEKVEILTADTQEGQISFRFQKATRSGQVVLSAKNISKSFGDNHVLSDISFQVERSERIAIVGANGAGKSTLVKILTDNLLADSGSVELGHNVELSYFAQHQTAMLRKDFTALEEAESAAPMELKRYARSLLGSFMFTGDDALKKVAVLSGGEKNRLALAKMLLKSFNLLILDEPTNHLDINSKKVLQQAIKDFDGTLIIVSHDRDFVDPLVSKVIEVSKSKTRTFLGNLSDYLSKIEAEKELQNSSSTQKSQSISNAKQRRIEIANINKEISTYKKALTQVEADMESLEEKKANIESKMESPDFYKDTNLATSTLAKYKEINATLDPLYIQWEDLSSKIEELNQQKF